MASSLLRRGPRSESVPIVPRALSFFPPPSPPGTQTGRCGGESTWRISLQDCTSQFPQFVCIATCMRHVTILIGLTSSFQLSDWLAQIMTRYLDNILIFRLLHQRLKSFAQCCPVRITFPSLFATLDRNVVCILVSNITIRKGFISCCLKPLQKCIKKKLEHSLGGLSYWELACVAGAKRLGGGGRVIKARKGTFLPNPCPFSFLPILYLVINQGRLFSILLDNGRSTARISREDDGV